MVPTTFTNFFLATSSGGAALIGLLFVATSISPERIFSRTASPEVTGVARSAFVALVNSFFISTSALLPHSNIGITAVVFALSGSINCLSLGFDLAKNRWQNHRQYTRGRLGLRIARDLVLVIGTLIAYLYELSYGIQLIRSPHDLGAIYLLTTMILVLYGIGLLRAWELLGAKRGGLLGWLNPLEQLDLPATEPQPSSLTPS